MNCISAIFAAFAAHFFPLELLLGAYAFLGPAHYLSEISWLHNRGYFVKFRWSIYALAILGALAFYKESLTAAYISAGIALAVANLFSKDIRVHIISFISTFSILYFYTREFYLVNFIILVVLVPTIIHVYFFTLGFMLHGLIKHKNQEALWAIVLVLLSTLSFFTIHLKPFSLFPDWTQQNIGLFLNVNRGIAFVSGLSNSTLLMNSLIKFLAFAYTFHYLNWFSKTGLTGWHKITKKRAIFLASIYLASITLYLYNYQIGLKALFYLSLLHVVLEFPLNAITFKKIFFTRNS